jgi:threonine/homoserine/homoserine lactone efflux protein
MLEQLLSFLGASILLTISPGPDIIYVLVQSISNGKRSGIWTAFGLVSGILIHTSLVAFGISALIRESPSLFLIIKIIGAGYLLFLAFQIYRSSGEIQFSTEKVPHQRALRLFRRGFLMNVINPKVTLFFLALLPGFLWYPEGNTVFQFYSLGLLFMLQAFLIFGAVAFLAGSISRYIQHSKKVGIILKWTQIVVFVGIAVFILI